MLAGMSKEELNRLHLHKDASGYAYLKHGDTVCEGRDDVNQYFEIDSAMKILMFSTSEVKEIMKILAALLHLGNIEYKGKVVQNLDTTELATSGYKPLEYAADLLEVDPNQLRHALTTRTIFAYGDTVVSTMSTIQAQDVKDAFVKGIYGRLFIFIVDKINSAIYDKQLHLAGRRQNSIGVLDIFGFENFQTNSFEQLLINYANESLQQFFVKHIFKLEQEEYNIESINWDHIEFKDNQAALNLIAIDKLNIMALIDEESKFPKGTDSTLLNKLHLTHVKDENYIYDQRTINASTTFCINHFAGPVCYETKGFLEKNRDTFSADLVQIISCSKNKFLNKLFVNDINMGQETRKRALTLSAQFKKSLESLMKQLECCQPFFIRCIKVSNFYLKKIKN